MKARTKTIEVIATRDSGGSIAVWEGSVDSLEYVSIVTSCIYSNGGTGNGLIAEDDEALRFIGGTYCGIRKGGMKRLSITTTVKEVAS
jgi:hypothetical protein